MQWSTELLLLSNPHVRKTANDIEKVERWYYKEEESKDALHAFDDNITT